MATWNPGLSNTGSFSESMGSWVANESFDALWLIFYGLRSRMIMDESEGYCQPSRSEKGVWSTEINWLKSRGSGGSCWDAETISVSSSYSFSHISWERAIAPPEVKQVLSSGFTLFPHGRRNFHPMQIGEKRGCCLLIREVFFFFNLVIFLPLCGSLE